jgi:hypothetical protein
MRCHERFGYRVDVRILPYRHHNRKLRILTVTATRSDEQFPVASGDAVLSIFEVRIRRIHQPDNVIR